jgi:hypothetical protein
VIQATRHRSGAHSEALADTMTGWWCRGGHNEAGRVGKQPKDDSSQRDHATIVPQLADGPATGSVRPGSNFCGAQAQFAGALSPAPAALDHYGWQQHCRGLFELPIAA